MIPLQDESQRKDLRKADKNSPEFFSNKRYENVEDALRVFKDDDLISKPGDAFNYTTHGYTLLSAVLEKAANKPFPEQAKEFFKLLGMNKTCLDENHKIVSNRTR